VVTYKVLTNLSPSADTFNKTVRVSAIRHYFKPGTYKAELTFGDVTKNVLGSGTSSPSQSSINLEDTQAFIEAEVKAQLDEYYKQQLAMLPKPTNRYGDVVNTIASDIAQQVIANQLKQLGINIPKIGEL
jgi:hypothetical protein